MMNAYDKVYLEKARTALGRMLDFAVHDLGYGLAQFYELFLASGAADRFGAGDYTLLVGKSGVELAYHVLEQSGIQVVRVKPDYSVDRSIEYWAGWALAYYQWETGRAFEEINGYIPIQRIADLYHPFHEMDIRQFCDKMNELYRAAKPDTNLKLHRLKADLTQKELADASGVPLRTIQQYEQRLYLLRQTETPSRIFLSGARSCAAPSRSYSGGWRFRSRRW